MKPLIAFLLIIKLTKCRVIQHKDFALNTSQIIVKYGYELEEHSDIQTEDGYLLTMYRIPCAKNCDKTAKLPVILVHGLMASSECWLFKSEESLSFELSDKGYDVWLANTRGSKHSRKHTKYDPDTNALFWKYSFHEIGYYDLPVLVDYILNKTRQNYLFYIGHSQGTTSLFVLLSTRPEYNQKIKFVSALAPIAFMANVKQPIIKYLSRFHLVIQQFFRRINIYEMFPQRKMMWELDGTLCSEQSSIAFLCNALMFMVIGNDWEESDISSISLISSHYPDDISINQLLHYLQLIHTGHFAMFDYGPNENFRLYNSRYPLAYRLSNVQTTIALFYAENDLLASLVDVEMLKSKIHPNYSYLVPHKHFNHFDFLVAKNVNNLLYNPLLNLMNMVRESFSSP